MSAAVTVIDYGIGNLYSVYRALEVVGARVTISSDPAEIASAQRLVLPGVGAFADGMHELLQRNLIDPIREFAMAERPLLAICLGAQLLATVSEEFGRHEGLGLIPGNVIAVPRTNSEGDIHKIPNIGWRNLYPGQNGSWAGGILNNIEPGTAVYLVHSFHIIPEDSNHLVSYCLYGGHRLTALIASRNIWGCQFHPEKSGKAGLNILSNFIQQ